MQRWAAGELSASAWSSTCRILAGRRQLCVWEPRPGWTGLEQVLGLVLGCCLPLVCEQLLTGYHFLVPRSPNGIWKEERWERKMGRPKDRLCSGQQAILSSSLWGLFLSPFVATWFPASLDSCTDDSKVTQRFIVSRAPGVLSSVASLEEFSAGHV